MKKTYISPEITIIALDKKELMQNIYDSGVSSGGQVDPDSSKAGDDEGSFGKGSTWFDDDEEEDW